MEGLRRLEGRLEWVEIGGMRMEGWYDTLKCSAGFVVMNCEYAISTSHAYL